jgi:hypothetical protein
VQERLDVAPAPEERRIPRLRFDRRDLLVAVPERVQIFRLELGDEGGGLLCSSCGLSHHPPPLRRTLSCAVDDSCPGRVQRARLRERNETRDPAQDSRSAIMCRAQRVSPGSRLSRAQERPLGRDTRFLTSSAAWRRCSRCRSGYA